MMEESRDRKRPRTDEVADVSDVTYSRPLTEEEEAEARRMADVAARAEARALQKKQNGSTDTNGLDVIRSAPTGNGTSNISSGNGANEMASKPKFLSKKEREELALQKLQARRKEEEKRAEEARVAHERFVTGQAAEERRRKDYLEREKEELERIRRKREENKEAKEHEHEVKAIRDHYLGVKEKKKKVAKPSEKFARIFQFDWEANDDTARNDVNPLYQHRVKINPLFGRGYIAGIDLREQRKDSNYLAELMSHRLSEARSIEDADKSLTEEERRERERTRLRAAQALQQKHAEALSGPSKQAGRNGGRLGISDLKGAHWSEKALEDMTERDWRIFREDFDIRIQGGRATLPLRNWEEAQFPSPVMRAIQSMGYEKPSPIQRQAIPIGLDKRDIIGIAETGSGKTAAFLIPMLVYLLNIPQTHIKRTCDEGPLAVVMAPTRELAQQIQEECIKLAKYTSFETVSVVGGQSIEEQGYILRKGVEIVIGTPGRMVDCIESNYLVLNQCNYVVLDEADRMIDMGFEPQVIQVLEAMGGLLKSEDEEQLEEQVRVAKEGEALYRVTAMFSATMPLEVERIAKEYLRHPAVIKIGDEESGKNKRIEQHVYFIVEAQKKNRLLEQLRRLEPSDKVIVFINSKKQGDVVGRFAEAANYRCGVLHGGRSQDQREETLEWFRSGDIQVLVATDVAGRGLDIPDVSHVINYDMPNKIENYCHRIGRTGRAGKSGTAITFLTEADTDVMYSLKNYLESTGAAIPSELARHSAAQAAVGTRDKTSGKLVGTKKDSVQYLN